MDTLGETSTAERGDQKSPARAKSSVVKFAIVGVAAIVLVLLPASAGAVHDLGLFQLDGNTAVVNPPPGDDWDGVYNHTSSAFGTKFIGADTEAPAVDTTFFTGGGSKDVNDIPQWQWSPNDVSPDKNQILDVYGAAYEGDSGHTIVYFGMDRYDTNGDSNVGFWFLQDQSFGLAADGSFTGVHKDGDIFILSAFGNGGSVPTIQMYKWQGGGLVSVGSGVGCTGSPVDDEACAAVNADGLIQVPWPYQDKDGTPAGFIKKNGFFEGGVDLNELFNAQDPDNAVVPCFTNFVGETRSSDSTSSQLKDFATGSLTSCGSIELEEALGRQRR